jgi:hypothetical protein
MVLQVIYWILILLAICGYWAPDPYKGYVRGLDLVLFIILGVKLFGIPS